VREGVFYRGREFHVVLVRTVKMCAMKRNGEEDGERVSIDVCIATIRRRQRIKADSDRDGSLSLSLVLLLDPNRSLVAYHSDNSETRLLRLR
jgi:hypothetical protein